MRKEFVVHSDAGHAWLEVMRAELKELGIEDKISGYSYQSADGEACYLEEDCDMSVFWRAYKEKQGYTLIVEDKYQDNSFVRNLPCYTMGGIG